MSLHPVSFAAFIGPGALLSAIIADIIFGWAFALSSFVCAFDDDMMSVNFLVVHFLDSFLSLLGFVEDLDDVITMNA